MAGIRGVISTLDPSGQEVMGPNVLLRRCPYHPSGHHRAALK